MMKPAFHVTWLFLAAAFFIQQAKYACPPTGSQIVGVSQPLTTVASATAAVQTPSSFSHLPQSLGWSTLPNTLMSNVCACTHGFPFTCGNDNSGFCRNVFNWSGGAGDTARMQLIVFGGGHTDYLGNEVYKLRLDHNPVDFVRAIDPTPPPGGCADITPAGGPNGRHTYGGETYIGSTDQFFITGGSLSCSNGTEANDAWTLDVGTSSWTKRCGSGNVCGYNNGLNGRFSAWDASTNDVWTSDRDFVYRYNVTSHVMTRVGTPSLDGFYTAVVDPIRKRLYVMDGGLSYVNIDPASGSYRSVTSVPSGSCSLSRYGGLVYDTSRQMIVTYTSGSNIGEVNAVSPTTCTSVNPGGATPAALHDSSMGVLGRFQYFPPPVDGYVVIPAPNANVSFLRREAPLTEVPFATRCAQPGVVVCAGMNSQSEINAQIESTGTFPVTFDSSGTSCAVPEGMAGSARFQTNGSVNAGGTLRWAFGPYGNNTTFYFSFRQCWDSNFGNRTFAGNEPHFKHFIMFNQSTGSCTDSQFVMENSYNRGLPQFYRSCSAPDLIIQTTDGDHALQWGVEGTHGPDNGPNNSFVATANPSQGIGWYRTRRNDDPGENNGLMYSNVIGQWVTFYCKVTTGTHGTPSSRLDCWSNVAGQNLKQQVALGQINWLTDTGGSNFGHIDIGPYITSGTAGSGAVGSTWYSQLIISTQPITPPTGPTP